MRGGSQVCIWRVVLGRPGSRVRTDRKKLHVLVVDDDSDAADTLCTLLRLWGHDCRAAYNGAAALQVACDYRPDCLVLDIDMPGLDGYILARSVRTEPGLDRAKLVALTIHSDEAHVRFSHEAGFDYHLVKPIEHLDIKRLKSLMDTLNELVRLAGKAEELTRQNVALASETKELLKEVKEDMKEVKKDIREIKEDNDDDMTEVKEDIREIKEDVRELKQEVREAKESRAGERTEDDSSPKGGSQAEGTLSGG